MSCQLVLGVTLHYPKDNCGNIGVLLSNRILLWGKRLNAAEIFEKWDKHNKLKGHTLKELELEEKML